MNEVTQILASIEGGDPHAMERLFPLVYDELRRLAAGQLAREQPGQTLQATALVHEVYIRLVDVEKAERSSRRTSVHGMLDYPKRHRTSRTAGNEWSTVTNPYQSGFADEVLVPTDADRRRWWIPYVGIALLMTGPVWLLMFSVQSRLLDAGIINTKDMSPLVGNETGTAADFILNVWHWDAVIFLLFLATIPNTVIGIRLLRKRPITNR